MRSSSTSITRRCTIRSRAIQSLNTAKVWGGEVHVIAGHVGDGLGEARKDVESALNGPMPKGYGDGVKAYFEKLRGSELFW